MGCSQSNIQSSAIISIEEKPQLPIPIDDTPLYQPSNRILENCIIVWLIDNSSIDIENVKTKLRQIISFIKTFTDPNECFTYMTSIQIEKVFLIVPSRDSFIHSTDSLTQIEKIYTFNSSIRDNENLKNESLPLNHFNDIDDLCEQLAIDVEFCEQDLMDITAYSISIQEKNSSNEFKKSEALFLYKQLLRETLIRIKFDKNAKNEFVNYFRMNYSTNPEQLCIINEFEINYRSQKIFWWLTRQCFIRKVLQRIQRTPEIDLHFKMGFLIKDLCVQLNNFQENNLYIAKTRWIGYYGKTMSNDQFDLLIKNNCRGLLSFSHLFIANADKQISIDFIDRRLKDFPNRIGILFEMHVNPTIRSLRSPLASTDELHGDEIPIEKNGVLFTMYPVFRIDSIEEIIEKSSHIWFVKLSLIDDNDPQLLRIVLPLRSSEVYTNPVAYLGKLFIEKGDYEHAEQFFLGLLQDTTVINEPRRHARIHKGLGKNSMHKSDYTEALEHYQKSLEISLTYLSSEHIDLLSIYYDIADAYFKQTDYINALQNYEKVAHLLRHSKQTINNQLFNDISSRIDTVKKLL